MLSRTWLLLSVCPLLLKMPLVILTDVVLDREYDAFDLESNFEAQQKMTNTIMPRLEELTPGGGAYLNEGDFRQRDWQNVFYGDNYARLKSIKERYDPDGLFYGLTGVGSEQWTVRDNGQLCRTSSNAQDYPGS